MKKILLFTMGAMMATPLFAQEDVTHLIQNAGFDEDLTFQADGTMKEKVSQESLSDRSWAFIAADNTVYARPKSTSSQQRKDDRPKEDAVNGFHGQVKGWTLDGVTFPKCEWMYFGSIAYGLPTDAVPVADDGDGYLLVPEKPEAVAGDDNKGFLYMRAGWTNSCVYKQEVTLPCAIYRLEYWTINVNPNSSATATDMSQITCRGEVFKDEEGTSLSSQEWVKHEFEFTPTSTFTMQFGYKSANQTSNNNPWVCLDGIKLYKIGEADREELINSDLYAMQDSLQEQQTIANEAGLGGLATEIYEYYLDLGQILDDGTLDEKEAAVKDAQAKLEFFKSVIVEAEKLDAIVTKLQNIQARYDFPGKAAFDEAVSRIADYLSNGTSEQILGAEEEANKAILDYMYSQKASEASPADYTLLVKNPWFINEGMEPTVEDGVATYEFEPADNLNAGTWYRAGDSGGDQNVKVVQSRTAWNAWKTNITRIAVAQDLELPNGYYTLSADLITQADYANQTQVAFAQSTAGKVTSPALTEGTWDSADNATGTGAWTTLTTEKVLVLDGKLTIGAEGFGEGATDQSGWFCATNFVLNYLGEPSDADKAGLLQSKFDAADDMLEKMHFAADKKALADTTALYRNATDKSVEERITAMAAALEEAQKSEDKYEEYWQDGKTLPTLRDSLAQDGSYGAAKEFVQFAYDYAINWIACDTATYKDIDAQVNLTKNYVNTYAPAYNKADEAMAKASAAGKDYISAIMAQQKQVLLSAMQDAATVNAYVEKLNAALNLLEKQNIADDENATDFTAFIINPMLQAETGWTFSKGNGNNNTGGGQWFNGDGSVRYIDSNNSAGLTDYIATQLVTSLPNGTYTVGAYVRTPAEGAYLLTQVAGQDTAYVEIPLYTYTDDEGAEQIASDTRGPIWEEAYTKIVEEGLAEDDPLYSYYNAIYQANNSVGRGWQHMEIAGLVVTDHKLTIGTACGSVLHGTEKVFAGNWYSVGGWTLTRTAKGDNSGWEGPIADGVETVKSNATAIEGIYTINGVRTNKLQRGLNIVIRNGKAQKIFVK